MSKIRDEYLQQHWTSYPEMPRGALKWGRIENCRLGMQNLTDWTMKDNASYKVSEALVDGDLIVLLPANQVLLLAPNLTGRSPLDNPWVQHQRWQEFLGFVRQIFREKRFLEVRTPVLVKCPGTEPSLDPFETEFKLGSKTEKFYLPTSPELNLKKLLAEGAEKIFEIAAVFRNGEKTEKHEAEFTMLEWYRAFSHLSNIKMDVIELVEHVCDLMRAERPKEVLTFTISDLFKQYCGFELKPDTTAEELKQLASKLNVDVSAASSIDDYFYLIFTDKIENQWPSDRLVFIEKYPPYQAALARIGADGWAERFEVYWNGLELGNAFHELNDPQIQRHRAEDDNKNKVLHGKTAVGLDESFFKALEFGLPPSAGIAMGLERLFMAMMGLKRLSDLKRIYNL